jgi:IS30 family transposase
VSRAEPLQFEEREIISRELACGRSARYISKLLGRHHSAISREISLNSGRDIYRAAGAQERCDEKRLRPKPRKLESCPRLHDAVKDGLEREWSPQQISRRLRKDHPGNPEMRVSHETIYECLYLQARGQLRTDLKVALRQGRVRRVPRSRTTVARGTIRNMVNVSERPAEAADRAV